MNKNEIGDKIIDAAMALHKELGLGLLETVYEVILAHKLKDLGLTIERQIAVPILYNGIKFDEGKIDVQHSVTEYIPYLEMLSPFDPASMTVHQVMTHSAGLPDYSLLNCDTAPESLSTWFIDHFNEFPFWSPPGRLWNYSNLGYSMTGLIAEEVSGQFYWDALRERILVPAGMVSSTFSAEDVFTYGNYATGHEFANDNSIHYITPGDYDCGFDRPAAFLYSSAREMGYFMELILNQGKEVISPQSIAEMTTAHIATHRTPEQYYGYGFRLEPYKSLQTVYHNGGVFGYLTSLIMIPERNFGVVVFLNASHYTSRVIAERAIDIMLDLPDSPPPDYSTDPETWTKYAYTFYDPYQLGKYSVYLNNDKSLFVTFYDENGSDDIEYQLFQSAGDCFYLTFQATGQKLYITFILDDYDQAEYFVTRYGVGIRVDETYTPSGKMAMPEERLFEISKQKQLIHEIDTIF